LLLGLCVKYLSTRAGSFCLCGIQKAMHKGGINHNFPLQT